MHNASRIFSSLFQYICSLELFVDTVGSWVKKCVDGYRMEEVFEQWHSFVEVAVDVRRRLLTEERARETRRWWLGGSSTERTLSGKQRYNSTESTYK